MLRMSHAIVSARYSAKIQVRCVAVWSTLPLCASEFRLVAKIWKQCPSNSWSICLLSPSRGIVRRARGQVRGRCTNSCSFSCPSINGTPAASSLVTPLGYRLKSMSYRSFARSRCENLTTQLEQGLRRSPEPSRQVDNKQNQKPIQTLNTVQNPTTEVRNRSTWVHSFYHTHQDKWTVIQWFI